MATHVARQAAARARRPAVSACVPIPASKITAPGVPDSALPRPRITKLIAQGTRWCPLTAVTAPAGAGKTMILALWAAAEPGPVAWVTVDEFDNRPGVFWAYVVAALRRSGVAVLGALPAAARERAVAHVFLLRLVAALAAQDLPVTLVLDDLHLLTGPQMLGGLDYVLRNARPATRQGLWARALRESSPLLCHWEPAAIGCADARRSFEVRGTVIKASLSKEKQDEIHQAPHGPGRSMSSAPAGGGEPGTGSRRRSPATLVTRCRHRLLPAAKALRAAAAASRLARA
jgi:hypothetical protein